MLVKCVRVVQLNCVKVHCMAYRKVGVCCSVYLFLLFSVFYVPVENQHMLNRYVLKHGSWAELVMCWS